jgi:hypothetical protein
MVPAFVRIILLIVATTMIGLWFGAWPLGLTAGCIIVLAANTRR